MLGSSPLYAQTLATWLGPVSGTWANGSLWSSNPLYPNNDPGGAGSYTVNLGAVGAPYTVTSTSGVTIEGLSLSSSDATLQVKSGVFQANGTVHLSGGTLHMNGGTLSAGTVTSSGGTLVLNGGKVKGTVLDTNALLASWIRLEDVTLASGRTLTVQANEGGGSRIGGRGLLSGFGEIILASQSNSHVIEPDDASPASTFTIGPGITVRLSSSHGSTRIQGGASASSRLINQGTIAADRSGYRYFSKHWENQGTIRAENRASIHFGGDWTNSGSLVTFKDTWSRLYGTWSNSGSISADTQAYLETDCVWTNHGLVSLANNSTLTLGGTWINNGSIVLSKSALQVRTPSSSMGTFQLSNSSIQLAGNLTASQMQPFLQMQQPIEITEDGELNNAGATVSLSAGSVLWTLGGGAIRGGTISSLDGTALAIRGLGRDSSLIETHLAAPVALESQSTLWIQDSTIGIPLQWNAGTVMLSDTDITVPIAQYSGRLDVHQSTIRAPIQTVGGTLAAFPGSSNGSSISIANGTAIFYSSDFSSAGSMSITNSVIHTSFLEAMPNVSMNGSTVRYAGSIDLAGGALDVATTPLGRVAVGKGAYISSGTLYASSGSILFTTSRIIWSGSATQLRGITLGSNAYVDRLVHIWAPEGLALSGTSIRFVNQNSLDLGTAALSGSGTVDLRGNVTVSGGEIGPTITVRTTGGGGNTIQGGRAGIEDPVMIVNKGHIITDSGGATHLVNLINAGTIEVVANPMDHKYSGTYPPVPEPRMINHGTLIVRGSTATLASDPTIPGDDVLVGGFYSVSGRGQLITNTIRTNSAHLRLDGGSASFAALKLQGNTGTFAITNGFNYTTPGNLANSGLLVIGANSTMRVAGALNNSGSIDLTGTLIVNDPPPDAESDIAVNLLDQLATGYNGGVWNGGGVFSSVAAADPKMGIGYVDLLAEAAGMTFKLTLVGDANLDGFVNQLDLDLLAPFFGLSSSWIGGDFNYDQATTLDDLNLLAPNWAPGIEDLNQALAELNLPSVSVPEPKSVLLALAGLMHRYRRRTR